MPFGAGKPPAVTAPARVLDGLPVGTQPRGVFQPHRKGLPLEGCCRQTVLSSGTLHGYLFEQTEVVVEELNQVAGAEAGQRTGYGPLSLRLHSGGGTPSGRGRGIMLR